MIKRSIWVLLLVGAVACGGKKTPPVARPTPPPPGTGTSGTSSTVAEPTVIPPEPVLEDTSLNTKDLDSLNRDSPLQPAFFAYDSSELDAAAQQVLSANAQVLKQYPTWVITIEGHADERGTVEYNLALGEQRAQAAKAYLTALGVDAARIDTISYGEQRPADAGHDELAWAVNRRAHFLVRVR
jgi:peptidoglycan-associated lipoprotein